MSHRPDNEPTAVYRLYDANDVLLYLGASYDPDVRWKQHLRDKHWTHLVVRRTVEWYPDRPSALAAEEAATAAEKPLHDSSWRKSATGERPQWLDPEGRQKAVEGLSAEIAEGKFWIGQVLMSGDVAQRFNVAQPTARNAMDVLAERGLLRRYHYGRYTVLRGPTKEEFDARGETPLERPRELHGAYLVWTVAELREALKSFPDDTLISARLATQRKASPRIP